MISSGIFVLPGIAFSRAGPAVIGEVVLVAGLLSILVLFVAVGLPEVEALRYRPFIKGNWNTMASGVGFVFVSFGGLINATSIAGEVRRPARSLPLGFLGAIIVVTVLYVLCRSCPSAIPARPMTRERRSGLSV
jgi:amino acid transporter